MESAYVLLTMSLPLDGAVVIDPVVMVTDVNVPAAGVDAPIIALLIDPPDTAGVLMVGLVSVLLVSVWLPVKVATVLSMAIVTGADPL
jgi:hypothetical protein